MKPGHSYEHYAPAYRTAYEGFHKNPDKKFDEIEADLAVEYRKHHSALPWDGAKNAARVAWDNTERRDRAPGCVPRR